MKRATWRKGKGARGARRRRSADLRTFYTISSSSINTICAVARREGEMGELFIHPCSPARTCSHLQNQLSLPEAGLAWPGLACVGSGAASPRRAHVKDT